jgi:hypothetical protein
MNRRQICHNWKYLLTSVISFVIVAVIVLSQGRALAQDSPQAVVNEFYQWYLKTESVTRQFSQQKAAFDPELYTQLVQAWAKQPGQDAEFVDFDVFSGTQVGMVKAVVRSVKQPWQDHTAEVDMDLYEGRLRNGQMVQVGDKAVTVKVLMEKKENTAWRIRNLVYAQGNWDNLLCILRGINRVAR